MPLGAFKCAKFQIPETYIGLEQTMQDGRHCIITDYHSQKKITVLYDDGSQQVLSYSEFQNGGPQQIGDIQKETNVRSQQLMNQRIGAHQRLATGIGVTVVEYVNSNKIRIRYDNGIEKWTTWSHFKVLNMIKLTQKEHFLGAKKTLKDGTTCEIVGFRGRNDLTVRFEDGSELITTYSEFAGGLK